MQERRALIRLSDGVEFGLEWYRSLFDKLIASMQGNLRRLYRGSFPKEMELVWEPQTTGRPSLAPSRNTIGILANKWKIDEKDMASYHEFAGILAE